MLLDVCFWENINHYHIISSTSEKKSRFNFSTPKKEGLKYSSKVLIKAARGHKVLPFRILVTVSCQVKPKACWSKAGDVATKRPPRKFDSPANPQPLFHRTCCNRCEKKKARCVVCSPGEIMFQNISAASNVRQKTSVWPKGFETGKYQQLCSPNKYPVLAKKSHTIHRFSRMLQPQQAETWSEPKIIWRPLNWVFESSSKRWWSCCFIFDTPQKHLEQNLALSQGYVQKLKDSFSVYSQKK